MGRHRLSVEAEARLLVERLGGRWSSSGAMCRCPAHEDRTPSLSIRPGRTRLLLHCFAGCTAADVLRALETVHLLDSAAAQDQAEPNREDRAHNAAALQIWETARSLDGTPVAGYLAARGIETRSPELRFHPRAPHGPQPLTRYHPAMIAAVRDDCDLVAIHRTFLDLHAQGRAAGRSGLGRFGRGAVRLGGFASRLGLAEGIETALAATALFAVPCWATLGAERFGVISVPADLKELHLFLDHDSGGKRAEKLARGAFAHVQHIEAHYPERPGEDWNDVLQRTVG